MFFISNLSICLKKFYFLLIFTFSFTFILTNFLISQENSSNFIGSIFVGDSKREVSTSFIPNTNVDQIEMNDRQASTLAELIDSVPGVHLINGSTPQGSGINIRGFGANDTYGTDQKVSILIDGSKTDIEEIYRIGNQLFTDPELFNSLSVTRGTIGSFEYGSGIVGGVVKMQTKDASDFTGNNIGFKLRQKFTFSSNTNGILSSSILAWQPNENNEFLFNYIHREQSDQKDANGNIIGASAFDLPSWLIKGKHSFGENNFQSVSLTLTETNADEKDVPYDTFSTTAGTLGNVDRKTFSQNISLNYDYVPFDNQLIDLNANLSYSDQQIDQEYVDGTSNCNRFPLPEGCFGPVPPGGYGTVNADHRYETTKLTVKNTSLIETDEMTHELKVGAESLSKERKSADSAPGGKDERMALFLIDEISFNNNLIFTPAIRYESQKITDETNRTGPYENSALMGGASAQYNFLENFSAFVSSAYTENLPIMDDLYASFSNRPQPELMSKSEKSNTVELGTIISQKSLISENDKIVFKITGYQTDLNDVTSYSRVESVNRNGVEVEASYSSINGFYLDLNIDQSEGKQISNEGVETDWSNQPADTYRLTLGRKFKNLDLSWEVFGANDFKNDTTEVDGFTSHNFRLTYLANKGLLKDIEFRLGVENLTNLHYTSRLSTRPAPGRNLKVSLARSF